MRCGHQFTTIFAQHSAGQPPNVSRPTSLLNPTLPTSNIPPQLVPSLRRNAAPLITAAVAILGIFVLAGSVHKSTGAGSFTASRSVQIVWTATYPGVTLGYVKNTGTSTLDGIELDAYRNEIDPTSSGFGEVKPYPIGIDVGPTEGPVVYFMPYRHPVAPGYTVGVTVSASLDAIANLEAYEYRNGSRSKIEDVTTTVKPTPPVVEQYQFPAAPGQAQTPHAREIEQGFQDGLDSTFGRNR